MQPVYSNDRPSLASLPRAVKLAATCTCQAAIRGDRCLLSDRCQCDKWCRQFFCRHCCCRREPGAGWSDNQIRLFPGPVREPGNVARRADRTIRYTSREADAERATDTKAAAVFETLSIETIWNVSCRFTKPQRNEGTSSARCVRAPATALSELPK